jgi:hypothetical protein
VERSTGGGKIMSVTPRLGQHRNELCGCGSGLKHKWCHGDVGKMAILNRIVQETMVGMIMKEKHKRKLIDDAEYNEFLERKHPDKDTIKSSEYEVGELLDKSGLKRCSGALCGAPIPDTEEFCPTCRNKLMKGN